MEQTEKPKYKFGDFNTETGKYFMCYAKSCKNGEWWASKEKMEEKKSKIKGVNARSYDKRRPPPRVLKTKDEKLEYHRNYYREDRKADPTKYAIQLKRYRGKKYATNPMFVLECRIRDLIRHSMKAKGWSINGRTQEILGCDWTTFKTHMESKFKDGMTWSNHSVHGWHIDHITPMTAANSPEDLIRLFHYSNTQPLWASENLAKGAKIQQPETQIA